MLALGAVGMVFWRAWVADDAFITFRHVFNCLAGHGPVFNIGERVQGFTHPLWFMILLAGGACFDVYGVAVAAGLVCTAIVVLGLAWYMRRQPFPAIQLCAVMAVLLSSRTFVEFQTSGLESSLTNALVVILFGGVLASLPVEGEQPTSEPKQNAAPPLPLPVVVLLCVLLVMNRPDQVTLCGPIGVWAFVQLIMARRWRLWILSAAAVAPAIAWYGFATIYYGTPLPNTAYAKMALPASIAKLKGILYLRDYAGYEPAQALLASLCLLGATFWAVHLIARRKPGAGIAACLVLGLWLQLACVVREGGDFMRGRTVVSVLVGTIVFGGMLLGRLLPARDLARPCSWAAAIVLLVVCPLKLGYFEARDGFVWGWNYFRDEAIANRWLVVAIMIVLLGLWWVAHRLLTRWDSSRRSPSLFAVLVMIQTVWLIAAMGSLNLPGPVTVIMAVVWIGSAFLVACLMAGRTVLQPALLGVAVLLAGTVTSLCDLAPRLASLPRRGADVTDEFAWYANAWYDNRFHEPRYHQESNVREWVRTGDNIHRYAERFGPITVAAGAIGMFSCHAGPKVTVVDEMGLTDAYIARLKADPISRIGHMEHAIAPGYLKSRAVVNLQPNWRDRVEQLDPTLLADALALQKTAQWPDPTDQGKWELVNLMTTGKLFDRERLAQIPRYAWPHR